ncbi:MAG: hypothetical protein ACL7BU_09355 [Candidatus Phlomobacter fragariae]
MNDKELKNMLDEHKVYINSFGEKRSIANLWKADLPDHTFIITAKIYLIIITNGEYPRAGCQQHTTKKWRKFTKKILQILAEKMLLIFIPGCSTF